jgi:hypothetical protein
MISAILGAGALLALSVVSAPSASATPGLLKNSVINKCATLSGGKTANYTQVTLWTCDGDKYQNWHTAFANGGYEVINNESGRCLTPYGGLGKDGTDLVLFDCNGSTGQIWGPHYEQLGSSVVTVQENGFSKAITGWGGDTSDGTFLTEYTWNNDPTQGWQLPN